MCFCWAWLVRWLWWVLGWHGKGGMCLLLAQSAVRAPKEGRSRPPCWNGGHIWCALALAWAATRRPEGLYWRVAVRCARRSACFMPLI